MSTVGKFDVTAFAFVEVTVRDEDAIERVIGPRGDEWRSHAYNLHARDQVFGHWVYNALVNGVDRVNRLDGWADMADDAVTFEITGVQLERSPEEIAA